MTPAEIMRILSNVIRIGTVTEVDLTTLTCRVKTGELVTDWLKWTTGRAGKGRSYWAPTPGEQVVILAMNGELTTAFIIGSLYSQAHTAPSHSAEARHETFSDGAVFEYEPKTGHAKLTGIQTADINASNHITATAQNVTINASVAVHLNTPNVICSHNLSCATLNVTKGGEMHGSITHTGGTFSSNGIVVDTHTHGGVERGGSTTGQPQ